MWSYLTFLENTFFVSLYQLNHNLKVKHLYKSVLHLCVGTNKYISSLYTAYKVQWRNT